MEVSRAAVNTETGGSQYVSINLVLLWLRYTSEDSYLFLHQISLETGTVRQSVFTFVPEFYRVSLTLAVSTQSK